MNQMNDIDPSELQTVDGGNLPVWAIAGIVSAVAGFADDLVNGMIEGARAALAD